MDRLVKVNQSSQLRKYKYDDMGRLLFEKIPEQSATINDGTGTYWTCKYTYTDYNAVATKTDARGVVTSYSYDDLRRMTGVSYNVAGASGVASTPSVTYSYDTGSTSATKGLLLSVSVYNQSSESYSYDTDNRLSSLTRTIGTRNYATGYTYTTANQLTQLTYPSTRAVNINHDSTGRLSSVVNNSDSANYLSSISYNYAGQTTAWTLGSNIAESFGYDSNRLQMTSQTVTQSGSTRLSLSYSYVASSGQMGGGSTAGNAGQLMSVSGSIGGQTESAAYTYDNVGRLVTSNQTSNSVSAQRRFVYDRWGNRSEVYDATSGGSQIQSVSLEQSGGAPTNRITSVTEGSTLSYTYDAAGNVTSDGVHSYTYDAENRVVSVDSGSTATYSYDHANRRVKKTVGSTTTHYVWEGSRVIAEHNGSTGAVTTEYIYTGSRMIAREGGGKVFFLYDRLSARATITDGQGGIQGRQSHLPFGEELVATGTTDKHRFTSYERDSETGTDYAVNRQYAQGVGRFTRVDPVPGKVSSPQTMNRYVYVRNNPTNFADPLGLDYVNINCELWLHIEWWETPGGDVIVDQSSTYYFFKCSANIVREEGSQQPRQGRGLDRKTRNAFKTFLSSLGQDCIAAMGNYIGQMMTQIDTVDFYDLDSTYTDGRALGFQPAANFVSSAQGNETLMTWFLRRHGGDIWNTATAVFDANASNPGIYYAGNTTQFAGGNMYLLMHEMLHMVSGLTDAQLVQQFGIQKATITNPDGTTTQESDSAALSRWINDGCRP